MSLLKQLTRWKIRGQIDQDVIDIILTLQSRLEHHWRIDVSIPTVITLLLHIANSLYSARHSRSRTELLSRQYL